MSATVERSAQTQQVVPTADVSYLAHTDLRRTDHDQVVRFSFESGGPRFTPLALPEKITFTAEQKRTILQVGYDAACRIEFPARSNRWPIGRLTRLPRPEPSTPPHSSPTL